MPNERISNRTHRSRALSLGDYGDFVRECDPRSVRKHRGFPGLRDLRGQARGQSVNPQSRRNRRHGLPPASTSRARERGSFGQGPPGQALESGPGGNEASFLPGPIGPQFHHVDSIVFRRQPFVMHLDMIEHAQYRLGENVLLPLQCQVRYRRS
jgi:hypothetical protein